MDLSFQKEIQLREVVLVNMPFADRRLPSFALSQLAALVRRDFDDEFNVRVCYSSHDFVRFLGADLYDTITSDLSENLAGIGDWLFRAVAFPDDEDNAEEYFTRYYAGRQYDTFRGTILRRRSALYGFCQGLADQYGLGEADVVGFSSMFAQTVPSLAIAPRAPAASGRGCWSPVTRTCCAIPSPSRPWSSCSAATSPSSPR